MTQHITSKHEVVPEFEDSAPVGEAPARRADAGCPAGGTTTATGLSITWQNGPLGRGAERKEPNGAFVETVILAAIDRLRFYQTAAEGKFACHQNANAIEALVLARELLEERTKERELRGVEGTQQV